MREKVCISFGPRKILDIPRNYVCIAMKKDQFNRLIGEISRVQGELAKGNAVVVKKVLKGTKVIYEYEEAEHEGSARHRRRDQKRRKKK